MATMLTRKFFDRPTLAVARDLPGKYLVREYRGRRIAVMVTEVEAYDGPRDLASHASRGRTPRTTVMFGPAGYFYIYFTYGMHWLVNVVTGPQDYPAAVLIRAGAYRDPKTRREVFINGPARLTRFLKIDGALNGEPAARAGGLWFEDHGVKVARKDIKIAKRVGVDYAGPVWSEKKYNFKITGKLPER
ncbi:MAG TPA: DNA-3-methyladenine glycosylase [Candidatus Paceibacterota bacterium]|nr:DNA-3-methyladenine glycosylase [Candidatus Paceibacterota bacterium]